MQLTALCKVLRYPALFNPKSWLIMKLTTILILAGCLQVSARTFAQTVTLSVKNTSLEKVFLEIKKQTGYNFVYNDRFGSTAKPVSVAVKQQPLANVLEECFRDQNFTYEIIDKTIIIKEKLSQKKEIEIITMPFSIDVHGIAKDENGKPLPGVNISSKGGKVIGVTNDKGEFMLTGLAENSILIFSAVTIETLEVKLNGKTQLEITLKEKINVLNEVIVNKGYYSTSKKLNIGSVVKISAEEISKQPVSNPLGAIQGRASGVFIQTQNGLPGGNIKVQIRGQGSVAAGTAPLYIIDGVTFLSNPFSGAGSAINGANGAISPFSIINPSDIESIEILKDAEATAIYGSRGANGVILITTKKGAIGKTKLDINVYQGYGTVSHYADYLNLKDYLKIRREAFANAGVIPTASNAIDLTVWDTTKSTDWQKYIFGGTAHVTNVQTELSGGDKNTRFLFGVNFRNEGTILPGDNRYSRYGTHFSVDHVSDNDKFSASIKMLYGSDDNLVIYDASAASFASLPPNFQIYNSNGSFNWSNTSNPEALLLRKSESKSNNLIASSNFRYTVSRGLTLRFSAGYTRTSLSQISKMPKAALNPDFGPTSSAFFGNNSNESFITEPQVDFSKVIGKGKLGVIVGSTFQQNVTKADFLRGSNYSNDDLLGNLGAAGTINGQSNSYIKYKYGSLYSRVNYQLDDKYIFSANFRRDGSSRFGPDKEFGNFWAIGTGWIFSNENIFKDKLTFLSFGKIRASYGLTGNDQISDYGYLSTLGNSSVYGGTAGLRPLRIANPEYSWETNKKFEIALELGFIKDKVMFTAAFYNNKSGNQLIPYPIPSQTGFTQYQANLPALVQNSGVEFELNTVNIANRTFSWKTSANITLPRNKLISYPGLEQSSFANTYVVGEDLSIVKRIHFLGVDPATGIALFEDVNKDNQLTFPQDYKVIGKTSPDFFGGLNNTLTYKKFELSFLFQFIGQHSLGSFPYPGNSVGNTFGKAIERWQKPGDVTSIPIPIVSSSTPASVARQQITNSDFSFLNTSYLRFKTIYFSYSLSESLLKRMRLNHCSIYVEGQNIFTITGKSFVDPETLNGTNPAMPPVRQIVGGIRITF